MKKWYQEESKMSWCQVDKIRKLVSTFLEWNIFGKTLYCASTHQTFPCATITYFLNWIFISKLRFEDVENIW